MPQKEIIAHPDIAQGSNPLSQRHASVTWYLCKGAPGRHPATGENGADIRQQTRFALERIKMILEAAALPWTTF